MYLFTLVREQTCNVSSRRFLQFSYLCAHYLWPIFCVMKLRHIDMHHWHIFPKILTMFISSNNFSLLTWGTVIYSIICYWRHTVNKRAFISQFSVIATIQATNSEEYTTRGTSVWFLSQKFDTKVVRSVLCPLWLSLKYKKKSIWTLVSKHYFEDSRCERI